MEGSFPRHPLAKLIFHCYNKSPQSYLGKLTSLKSLFGKGSSTDVLVSTMRRVRCLFGHQRPPRTGFKLAKFEIQIIRTQSAQLKISTKMQKYFGGTE